jgi:hypothetical protein
MKREAGMSLWHQMPVHARRVQVRQSFRFMAVIVLALQLEAVVGAGG